MAGQRGLQKPFKGKGRSPWAFKPREVSRQEHLRSLRGNYEKVDFPEAVADADRLKRRCERVARELNIPLKEAIKRVPRSEREAFVRKHKKLIATAAKNEGLLDTRHGGGEVVYLARL